MTSITQTVPAYSAGISEQPDHLKFPGQLTDIVNAIPDITKGLYKRPGSKRVGTAPLANVQSGGSWFHYFRDENEGAYIGQIDANGDVKIWKASGDNAGAQQNVVYGTGGATANKAYLATNTPENLQFLTINDTTFVSNRDTNNANTLVRDSFDATYTQSGTTATISYGFHELTVGYNISITFTGAASGDNGRYLTVTAPNPNASNGTFTVTLPNSRTVGSATACTVTPLTPARPDAHFAFVDLLRTENGRQYGLNIFNSDSTQPLSRATKVKVLSSTYDETDGSGHCPGIGTGVFSATGASSYSTGDIANIQDINGTQITSPIDRQNLVFRFSALGQQGVSPNYKAESEGPGGQNYRAAYSLEVTLLHGGEGWAVGDTVTIRPTFASEAANLTYNENATPRSTGSQATVVIRVDEIETTNVKCTVNSARDGLLRPAPTPFDADTAITADTILGGITTGLPSGITARVIGTGVYYSSANPFNIEVVEEDLMRVMQTAVNDVSRLPNQCRNGYIVKVSNARLAEEDDYYLKFDGQNGRDGSGSWNECAKPDIARRLFNMPLVIQRTGLANAGTNSEIATFTVSRFTYQDRLVGDDTTNPYPSFTNSRINKVVFFRNRLALLSGENVILSRPGTFGTPDFFIESALTVGPADPIDISAASMFPSEIFDAIEINSGLVVFSSNQQFLLSTDSEILNPETAKLRSVAVFNYNKALPPLSLGTTVSFIDNSGKFSRLNEVANIAREGEPDVVEQSKAVPSLLPKEVDLLTNSRENSLVLLGKTGLDTVFGFKYFNVSDKRIQQAWFKWKFNKPLKYHFIINDEYYMLDSDNFLQSVSLVQSDDDISVNHDGNSYILHLDNYTTVANGVYDPVSNLTTFTNQSDWIDDISNPNGTLVVLDDDGNLTRAGRYAHCTIINNDDFTLPGNWSNATLNIGYLYEYKAEFPTIYPTKVEGEKSFSDINASLVIHRIKVHFGKIGLYETTLTRTGKPNYTEVYESTILDDYDASDAPYLPDYVKTVPVYERNTNVGITLKSSHPSPATLRGMSWEGDFSPRFYKRV